MTEEMLAALREKVEAFIEAAEEWLDAYPFRTPNSELEECDPEVIREYRKNNDLYEVGLHKEDGVPNPVERRNGGEWYDLEPVPPISPESTR